MHTFITHEGRFVACLPIPTLHLLRMAIGLFYVYLEMISLVCYTLLIVLIVGTIDKVQRARLRKDR